MKTLIAIPCMDQIPALFAQSLAMLQKEGDVAVSFHIGSLIYSSRNKLAKDALRMEADYVFWLDSDMIFAPDTFKRMMATMQEKDLDILSGIYYRRVEPYSPVLFDKLEIDEKNRAKWGEPKEIPDGLFEQAGIGFGCVLMRTDVLMDVGAKFGDMFAPIGGVGEDLSFCWRARQCGYKIMVDPSIPLGHVGHTVVTAAHYAVYKKQKGRLKG